MKNPSQKIFKELKKRIILILTLIILPVFILANHSNTVSFLKNQNQNSWITQALSAVNENNLDLSYIDENTTELMTASKYILALSAVNNPDISKINKLLDIINDNFDGNQLGSDEQLNDDFWGMLALSSIKQTENFTSIKNFILNNQNSDGGWSWAISGNSDTNDTAAAIMALLETDLNKDSSEIINALDYLQDAQNDDGGFPYIKDSQSDGSSTAWVISALNKANINPETWEINSNNPISFLESLEQSDGSYLWLASDQSGNILTTAYALIAVSGNSYPINHIDIASSDIVLVDLRIEGPEDTICLAKDLEATNVLELIEIAAQVCNYEYIIENTTYGPYLSSIAGVDADGMDGWQYWVNWEMPGLGASDFQLKNGDEILWAYGSALGIKPTKIISDHLSYELDEEFELTVKYFESGQENILANKEIRIGTDLYTSDSSGKVKITIDAPGIHQIYVSRDDSYIRSDKLHISISSDDHISQSVNLSTNIINSTPPDQISFSVSQSNIDFGDLNPGDNSYENITLTNTGNTNIYIESNITGNNLFIDSTSLNDIFWLDFSTQINVSNSDNIKVQLDIPQDYNSSGLKDGELIFWATAQ